MWPSTFARIILQVNNLFKAFCKTSSDVVLEARPWPRGQFLWSWPWPRDYGLGLGLEDPGLGFESCINNFLPSPSNSHNRTVLTEN